MRLAVALPVLAEDIGQLGARFSCCLPMIARQHSCLPVMVDGQQLLMASPNPLDPDVEEELRLRFGMPLRTVLCTPANISDALTKFVPRDAHAVEAAGAPLAAVAAPAVQAAPAAATAVQPARPAGPLTDAEKKDRQSYAFVAFNITVMAVMGLLSYGLGRGWAFSAAIAIPLAAAAATVTWKMKSR